MTRAVFVLGALMIAAGLFVISYGVPLVRMEIGWTAVIGGSVAASAGCVILVLGVFLLRLDTLQTSLDRLAPVAMPEDLPAHRLAESALADPTALPASIRPFHPLSPAARYRDDEEPPETAAVQPEMAAVQPEPPLEATLADEPVHEEPPPAAPPPSWAAQPTLIESAPALVHAEEEASHPPPVLAPDPVADPVAEAPASPPRSRFFSSLLTRRPPEPRTSSLGKQVEPVMPEPPSPIAADLPVDLSSGWSREGSVRSSPPTPTFEWPPREAPEPVVETLFEEPTPAPVAEEVVHAPLVETPEPEPVETLITPVPVPPPETPPPVAAEPDPLEPVVVGRYNAGAASYVMFSNGMIQVETDQGTHEFASMQELKAFIENRDARVS